MKKNTLYVVSTPNENHFFFNSKEAREDYRWCKSEIKKMNENGEIAIFKMNPLLDEEGQVNNWDDDLNKYFQKNLDPKKCERILSENI